MEKYKRWQINVQKDADAGVFTLPFLAGTANGKPIPR